MLYRLEDARAGVGPGHREAGGHQVDKLGTLWKSGGRQHLREEEKSLARDNRGDVLVHGSMKVAFTLFEFLGATSPVMKSSRTKVDDGLDGRGHAEADTLLEGCR